MKGMLPAIIVFFSLTLALGGCKKKDPTTTEQNHLFSKTWKVSTTDKNLRTNPAGKILYQSDECIAEDKYQFKQSDVLSILKEEGDCYLYKPVDVVGSYNLTSRELAYEGATFKIAEISATQIKYYTALPSSTGYDYMVYLLE